MQAAIKIHFVCVHGGGGGRCKLILTLGCPQGHCSLWLIPTTVMVLVTCKFDEDPIKNEFAILHNIFLIMSMGDFGCHGNESFDRLHPQMLIKPFPHPNDAIHNI